jgi:hypothetical protein
VPETDLGNFDQAIYTQLAAWAPLTDLLATSLSVHADEAPPTAPLPAVVFQRTAPSGPDYVLGGMWGRTATYMVKGITEGHSKALAGSISAQLDAALNDAAFPIAQGTLIYCRRVEDIDYPEQAPGGRRFNHLGGVYRLQYLT